jgi:hypothetical protein
MKKPSEYVIYVTRFGSYTDIYATEPTKAKAFKAALDCLKHEERDLGYSSIIHGDTTVRRLMLSAFLGNSIEYNADILSYEKDGDNVTVNKYGVITIVKLY